jgi:hypothetical protein
MNLKGPAEPHLAVLRCLAVANLRGPTVIGKLGLSLTPNPPHLIRLRLHVCHRSVSSRTKSFPHPTSPRHSAIAAPRARRGRRDSMTKVDLTPRPPHRRARHWTAVTTISFDRNFRSSGFSRRCERFVQRRRGRRGRSQPVGTDGSRAGRRIFCPSNCTTRSFGARLRAQSWQTGPPDQYHLSAYQVCLVA